MADISNAHVQPNLSVDHLENEHTTLISLLLDESGSMDQYKLVMKDSIKTFKDSLKNSKQADEMLVSITRFNGQINSSGFQLVDDIQTDYNPHGGTLLYDSVITARNQLYNNGSGYLEQLQSNGIRTKGIVVVFSDGEDNGSSSPIRDAVDAIASLTQKEITVAFVAFGQGAKGIAQQLGISQDNILETNASESELRKVFDVLSKSAISASKGAAAGQSQSTFFV